MTTIASLVRGTVLALAATAMTAGAGMAQDVLKIGSTPSGIPFTFLDVKTNQIDGVMVDIIKAIGEVEGFSPQIQATQFNALLPSLTSGKIDVIAAAMYATPERAKIVAFSEPVYSYGEGLFVKSDDKTDYKTLDDLAGKTAGVQVGTAYVAPLQASDKLKEVKVYDTISDIMRDVAIGRIDAGFGDKPIVAYQLSQGASAKVRLVTDYDSQYVGNVAIAVRQDDPALLAKMNDGLKKIKDSGKLDESIKKWGIE
ncbi:amino acid ABC transporter substrate-binding protein [Paracoccus suum]|uniref:Amino acid ABC transporter substrate-binding protein n=1 Tax=Paracoccus suum TaxID=2259340 RepID=A0A344PKS4_9RHOB|nr:ABC transporter substrate-binding protein [Paracoccus suum]AXC49979.1 amino acid ABC transporter substrate-binding protein [Paracoccus suum]